MAEATLKTAHNYRELAEKWANKYHKVIDENREALQGLARRGLTEVAGLGVGLADGITRGLWGDPANGDITVEGVDVHIALTVLGSLAAVAGAFGEVSEGVAVVMACESAIVTSRQTERFVRQAAK